MATFTARSALRGAAVLIAAILVMFMLLSQLLAVLPVDWLGWALRIQRFQAGVLRLGNLRDGLGIWNVLIGALSAALSLILLLTARGSRRWQSLLAPAGVLGFGLAIVTTTELLLAVGELGVATQPLRPSLPFVSVGGSPDATVTFGNPAGKNLRADLYLQAGALRKPHPVVVYIHGGGFAFGGRAPNAYTRFLADHGYVVMDIDYRLATIESATWRTAVADVGCALVWIKTHAMEYAMDADRVATFGESAGGNLAINAAYMANNGTLQPACGTPADVPNVRAAIGGYPAIDLTHGTRATAIGRLVGRYYVGGPSEQYPAAFAQVDSATHISTKSPPTLIFQGSRDHLVMAAQVREFAALLSTRGVVSRYVEYPGFDHGCGDSDGVLTYTTAANRLLTLQWLDRYVKS